jgi:ABC-type Co2+ transport system permease subunit
MTSKKIYQLKIFVFTTCLFAIMQYLMDIRDGSKFDLIGTLLAALIFGVLMTFFSVLAKPKDG